MSFDIPIWNPDWNVEDDTGVDPITELHHPPLVDDSPLLDYEMSELTWEDGKLCFKELGPQRVHNTPFRATVDTLESLVDLATHAKNPTQPGNGYDEGVPRMDCPISEQSIQDAIVPCQGNSITNLDSRSVRKKVRFDKCLRRADEEEEFDGFRVPTASFRSEGKTTTNDKERKNSKPCSSTKRSRASSATHTKSERKRRDMINEKIRTLQQMVPYSNKTDIASILDSVIDHIKDLQAHLQMMMSNMNTNTNMNMNMMMSMGYIPMSVSDQFMALQSTDDFAAWFASIISRSEQVMR